MSCAAPPCSQAFSNSSLNMLFCRLCHHQTIASRFIPRHSRHITLSLAVISCHSRHSVKSLWTSAKRCERPKRPSVSGSDVSDQRSDSDSEATKATKAIARRCSHLSLSIYNHCVGLTIFSNYKPYKLYNSHCGHQGRC